MCHASVSVIGDTTDPGTPPIRSPSSSGAMPRANTTPCRQSS